MARDTVIFSNFADGEYGLLSSDLVGFRVLRQRMLYVGWWTGTNVARSIGGHLYPMPQPAPMAATGLPSAPATFGIGRGAPNSSVPMAWVVIGHSVYQAGAAGAALAFTKISDAGITNPPVLSSCVQGQATYLKTEQEVIKVDHGAATVTTLNATGASASPAPIAVYGDRLVYTEGANRVFFSAPADFTSWPAANFFDVGDATVPIGALVPLRSGLAIAKGVGADTAWWLLQGVPGFDAVLRRVAEIPGGVSGAVALGDGTIGYWPSIYGTGQFPCIFNGAAVARSRYLDHKVAAAQVVALNEPGDWFAFDPGTGHGLLRRDGAWSYHDFSPAASTGVASDTSSDLLLFSKDATHFFKWAAYSQHPTTLGTGFGANPAAASFSLPEWWATSGDEVAVNSIFVDFVKWATADTVHNSFTVTPVAMRTYDPDGSHTGGGDLADAKPITFDENPTKVVGAFSRGRKAMKFASSFGNGFRVDFSGMRGVEIEKVVVVVDVRPAPGV